MSKRRKLPRLLSQLDLRWSSGSALDVSINSGFGGVV